jgi:phosphopantothenoylcysteine decarboxylase/phosphopantothenate--cysteine ligase
MLLGKTVVLGVTGSIAAYQAVEIIAELKRLGVNVFVIMTKAATKFVAPLTLRTVSQNPVVVEMFAETQNWNVQHIVLADLADLMLIAPATANIICKLANGIADDMLSTTVMATKAPVVIAPAMNTNMYENPILQSNIEKLKMFGYEFIEPEYGKLACGYEGKGRLAKVGTIVNKVINILEGAKPITAEKEIPSKAFSLTRGT